MPKISILAFRSLKNLQTALICSQPIHPNHLTIYNFKNSPIVLYSFANKSSDLIQLKSISMKFQSLAIVGTISTFILGGSAVPTPGWRPGEPLSQDMVPVERRDPRPINQGNPSGVNSWIHDPSLTEVCARDSTSKRCTSINGIY
jgi:hypothetical protein